MRKSSIAFLVLTPLLAVAGFFLRRMETDTIFDPGTGLARMWQPISIGLMALCAVSLIVFILLAKNTPRRNIASFGDGFSAGGFGKFFLGLSAIAVLLLSAYFLAAHFLSLSLPSVLEHEQTWRALVLSIGGILSGALMLSVALRGTSGKVIHISTLFTPLWLCALLMLAYLDYSMHPARLWYIYPLATVGLSSVAFYYLSAFAFDRAKPRRFLVYSALALVFIGITLGDSTGVLGGSLHILWAALALSLYVYQILLLKNLEKPAPELVTVAPEIAHASVEQFAQNPSATQTFTSPILEETAAEPPVVAPPADFVGEVTTGDPVVDALLNDESFLASPPPHDPPPTFTEVFSEEN